MPEIPDIDDYMKSAERQKKEYGKSSPWAARIWGLVGVMACLTGSEAGVFVGVISLVISLLCWSRGAGENPTDRPDTLWAQQDDTDTCAGISFTASEPYEWISDPFSASLPNTDTDTDMMAGDMFLDPMYSWFPANIFHESITDSISTDSNFDFGDTSSSSFNDPFNSGNF